MRFVCFSDWDQLPDSANALFAQGERDSLFFSRHWFESLSTTGLDDDQRPVLACVVSDDNVVAILPLIKSTGNTVHAMKHRYTPVYSLLIAKADQARVLACLARGLGQLLLDGVLLEPVADSDQKIDNLQRAMEAAGYRCEYLFRHYNWIYRAQGQSYAEYMASRPARLRNTIIRKQRKLKREHGYEIQLFIGDEVPRAMSDYYAVYNASWKANEQYADFVDDMVTVFSKAGWTRLAMLYIRGQPVAAQLWFVHHGKANIFRLAYDEMWGKYSPGSILTSYLMEYVIDIEQVEEIDFLTGNDAYKQDWMSERRERFALSCVKNVKPAGRYSIFVEALKRMLTGKRVSVRSTGGV